MKVLASTMRGMGVFKWPSLGLILLPIILSLFLELESPGWVVHQSKAIGGQSVRLETRRYLREGEPFFLRVRISGSHPGQGTLRFVGGDEASLTFSQEADSWVAPVTLIAPGETGHFQIILTIEVTDSGVETVGWGLGTPITF